MKGFTVDLWESVEYAGCTIINNSQRRAIAIECPTVEMATELIEIAWDENRWTHPLKPQHVDLVSAGRIVHLLWKDNG